MTDSELCKTLHKKQNILTTNSIIVLSPWSSILYNAIKQAEIQ